ncbi:hypothetical protein Sango_2139600 [Sesamum angolense]|uniref:Uncharacterized protein n=1 Tax=Sesamum angolense TaxID=2727404 RepID=A0AAE1WCB9_9LAMI|nr:hypothetical protein Sango_2139600 [Sesamum angolense]
MAQSNLKQQMSQTLNVGGPHSRSLSQPIFFANNCLPPLSPFPPSESSLASSNSNLKDASMEDVDVSSRGTAVAPSFSRENLFRGSENLLPCRGHRRSNSDVPLGFSDMMQSSPQLVPISSQGHLGRVVNMRGTSGNEKPIELRRREMDTVGYGKGSVEGIGDIKIGGRGCG